MFVLILFFFSKTPCFAESNWGVMKIGNRPVDIDQTTPPSSTQQRAPALSSEPDNRQNPLPTPMDPRIQQSDVHKNPGTSAPPLSNKAMPTDEESMRMLLKVQDDQKKIMEKIKEIRESQ